jgi:hypothetical protein
MKGFSSHHEIHIIAVANMDRCPMIRSMGKYWQVVTKRSLNSFHEEAEQWLPSEEAAADGYKPAKCELHIRIASGQ